jgi:hypothetical protein
MPRPPLTRLHADFSATSKSRAAVFSNHAAATRVEDPCEHQCRNNSQHIASESAVSVVASSRAEDQRVLLRASQLLHHVLACQRFPHRPERLLIHEPHRAPAGSVLCAAAAVVRPFARMRISRIAGVQRAICATDDVDEMHAPIVDGPGRPEAVDPEQNLSQGSDFRPANVYRTFQSRPAK